MSDRSIWGEIKPPQQYGIVYADPPWEYNDGRCGGGVDAQYATMRLPDICAMPVQRIAAPDCALFLWATFPKMPDALKVIASWGFTYKSIAFVWLKQNRKATTPFYGLGRWTRGNVEPCLLATRGKPERMSPAVHQLIDHRNAPDFDPETVSGFGRELDEVLESPIRRHSEKPEEARDKILKLMGPLPRVELFARHVTPGWHVWGNEVESDIVL